MIVHVVVLIESVLRLVQIGNSRYSVENLVYDIYKYMYENYHYWTFLKTENEMVPFSFKNIDLQRLNIIHNG